MAEHTDPRPEDIVVQLLRVLSEVDIETLGDDLRRVDTATTRRAMTGASLLAEALTRATFASTTLADALGVELDEEKLAAYELTEERHRAFDCYWQELRRVHGIPPAGHDLLVRHF